MSDSASVAGSTVSAGQADVPRTADPTRKLRDVKPIGNVWSWMKWTLIAYVVTELIAIGSSVAYIVFFDMLEKSAFSTDAAFFRAATLVDGLSAASTLIFFAVIILCIIAYARFFQRCMNNVQALGDKDATMPPGWVWGYHFIPILNLWKPVEGVLQIWRGSMRLTGRSPKVPLTIGFWWTSWLLSNFLGSLSLRLFTQSGGFEEVTNFDLFLITFYIDAAGSLVMLAGTALLFIFSRQLRRAQQDIVDRRVGSVFD